MKALFHLSLNFFRENSVPILLFFLILVHGSLLGLSDDEAYYWVLAQKPMLSYAFHPPAVAWLIGSFQFLLGGMMNHPHPGLVRFPAALSIAIILGIFLKWLKQEGFVQSKRYRASLVLLSFCGFFPLSWMMVPDIPLFLGWSLLFKSTWDICFRSKKFSNPSYIDLLGLGLGAILSILSKYSAILAVFSSLICLWIWAGKKRRCLGVLTLVMAVIFALLPIVIWNSQHQWASILYQIRDRHGGMHLSWVRYFRFWLIEALCAGPIVLIYTLSLSFRAAVFWKRFQEPIFQFIAIWVWPAAAVFCLQPLFFDFKPHWALVVWWPIFLLLAWISQGNAWQWIRVQVGYGLTVGVIILLSCHFPLISWVISEISTVNPRIHYDPKWDVTHDLYGWAQLPQKLRELMRDEKFPVIGSRYQTASQAAFVLGNEFEVTYLPRDQKEWDEWKDVVVSEGIGPDWPVLKKTIFFVSDIRYDAGPSFKQAVCKKIDRLEVYRFSLLAKWIDIWRCDPTLRSF